MSNSPISLLRFTPYILCSYTCVGRFSHLCQLCSGFFLANGNPQRFLCKIVVSLVGIGLALVYAENGKLVGIITRSDLLDAMLAGDIGKE